MSKKNIKKPNRDQQARDKKKHEESMKLPVNQFLNMVIDEKTKKLKYESAIKLRQYFLNNPDAVLDIIRQVNSLVHEVRHHKLQSEKALKQYDGSEPVTFFDKFGKLLEREELYSLYVVESQTVYVVLSKIRSMLVNNLLSKTSESEGFTFEMFDDYVLKTEKVIGDMGYELFPLSHKVIDPL